VDPLRSSILPYNCLCATQSVLPRRELMTQLISISAINANSTKAFNRRGRREQIGSPEQPEQSRARSSAGLGEEFSWAANGRSPPLLPIRASTRNRRLELLRGTESILDSICASRLHCRLYSSSLARVTRDDSDHLRELVGRLPQRLVLIIANTTVFPPPALSSTCDAPITTAPDIYECNLQSLS